MVTLSRRIRNYVALKSAFVLTSVSIVVMAISAMFLNLTTQPAVAGSAVVTNGRFTNVYVYPNSDKETWEQHIASLRPSDASQFSRASIDEFTQRLMAPEWPSYWDALHQYSGINPPRFFGSYVASKQCVDTALRDRHNGVLQWSTVRFLSNCHIKGMDPSPQVNLIFSPDIAIAPIVVVGTGPDMCAKTTTRAWHAWGINTPNFAALPISRECAPSFTTFTQIMAHEDVEMVSDPAGFGMGTLGEHELADNCEKRADAFTTWAGFSVERYWSNFDNTCLPKLDPPAGSIAATWVLGQGKPLQRFTGKVHVLSLGVPKSRLVTDGELKQAQIVIQTGGDDLRGGNHDGDNARVTLNFIGGSKVTANVNRGRSWGGGETHAAILSIPNHLRVSDITGVTISTGFGGGISGDNWNVDKVALIVSFPEDSPTHGPAASTIHTWVDDSGGPLIRFTGKTHDLLIPVAAQDVGKHVRALTLLMSTGNDDLRGGNRAGDNCDVTIVLKSGKTIALSNVNHGATWNGWDQHTLPIPLPNGGMNGGDVAAIKVHTGFGGGISGDNWNLQRVQLEATLMP
jgi:hypothetical protein